MFNVGRKRKYSAKGSQANRKKGGYLSKKRKVAAAGGFIVAGGSVFGERARRGTSADVVHTRRPYAPDRMFVKLRTVYRVLQTNTSGVFTTTSSCKLNSCLDPMGAAGSIAATGFAEWSNIYHSYQVQAAAIRVQVINNSSTVHTQAGVMFMPNLTTSPTTLQEATGGRFSKNVVLSGFNGGPAMREIRMFARMNEIAGDPVMAVPIDNTYSALTNADPATLFIADLFSQPCDGTSTGGCIFLVQLTQYVCFFGPNIPTP